MKALSVTRRDKIHEGVGRVLVKVPECLKKGFRLSRVQAEHATIFSHIFRVLVRMCLIISKIFHVPNSFCTVLEKFSKVFLWCWIFSRVNTVLVRGCLMWVLLRTWMLLDWLTRTGICNEVGMNTDFYFLWRGFWVKPIFALLIQKIVEKRDVPISVVVSSGQRCHSC